MQVFRSQAKPFKGDMLYLYQTIKELQYQYCGLLQSKRREITLCKLQFIYWPLEVMLTNNVMKSLVMR